MTHIKRGVIAHARHKKYIKYAKGYYGARSRVYRVVYQSIIKAGQYAYRDRKQRKRIFRKLWITRINAAVCKQNLKYNNFINGLKKLSIIINRKILSDIAIFDKVTFKLLINKVKNI
ncbi:50S ribosomal protein L20 [Enterobacteriaceae bacterium ET-AT1-13]|nr:50S ribosomal protein L20 [Enterobacteriaceae bacterium ET-AT1-13]WGS66418.1 50S ribosomal protein L20 [Enterobacteriaceae bacterium Cmel17]WMC17442.1 MAG: 50S ribosomal protein L20 [Enterobacteriaceae bacterium Cmel21]WMC17649.1 MAG: 50S ribosomal protein L20 [Enterobacteriaceae bacterium PSmelAO3-2]WMC17853.1 MAG: 50S ribosomal protein L20 [Enterobacteriaceae bacterium PSmelAO3-1]WMC18057.1 MAG: 50S ribosomal protein L20 [Enterobacteriaceae bacterium PSmelAO1]